MAVRPLASASFAALALSLGACQDGTLGGGGSTRHLTPIPPKTLALMQAKGMSQGDPILIRAYKKEAEMEVWKRGSGGQYALLKTFPICRWSGQLGPKTKQGDRQAPEGFYTVAPGQMNPNSAYHLSFDTGYPNAFDRANGRTGNYLMVHGTCSSAGCFAMTDESMSEIYAIAREAFAGGQRGFQFQSYPFRMTATNLAKFRNDPNAPFWRNLKEGSDYFETLREEPRVGVCGTRYVFGGADVAGGSCAPKVDALVAERQARDEREIAELVAKGTPATRVVYEDGSQNPVFRPGSASAFASLTAPETDLPYTAKDYTGRRLGEVSRPESLAAEPHEFEVDVKGRPVLMAAAPAAPMPTKAAVPAKAGPARTDKSTLVAKQEPAQEPAAGPAKPPRVAVADADGDPSVYRKLLGNLFSGAAAPPVADGAAAQAGDAKAGPASGSNSTVRLAAKPGAAQAREAAAEAKPAKEGSPAGGTAAQR